MTSITVDPGNAQRVYVGTRDAGVFKSIDGGQSWQPARTGLSFHPIRSLRVDPRQPSTLYAGTDSDGIWKSTNGGASWFKSSSGLDEGLIVYHIVIDPGNSNALYAGLAGGSGMVIGNIYKSVNGGTTWEMKDNGIPRSSGSHTNAIFSLAIDPNNPFLLYAGTNFHGAFRSTDGGGTWTDMNNGLPFRSGSQDRRQTVNALAVDRHHSNRPGAIINGDYYVFLNNNWTKISPSSLCCAANGNIFRDYLYFHPTNPSIMYSAGESFARSTDGGVTWTDFLGWTRSGEVMEISFHPSSPHTIYAASAPLFDYFGGVYKSTDQGSTWTLASEGIRALPIRSTAIDPRNPDMLFAGTGDGHLFRSIDGGETWSRSSYQSGGTRYVFGFEVEGVVVDPLNSQNVYAVASSLWKSVDQGNTFSRLSQVPDAISIAITPHASNPIYVGTRSDGIYKSSDSGQTWAQKNTGLPTFGSSICPILSLAVDPNNISVVWAGTQYGGGIVRSTDGGDHWEVKGLTDENFVHAIAIRPGNSNIILAGAGFFEGRIYKSVDGGTTWVEKLSGIGFVYDFKFDPRNASWIYAASEGSGVLRSLDGGETWHDFSQGIFYPFVYSLAIAPGDPPRLVAGSYGSGLWETGLVNPTLRVSDVPKAEGSAGATAFTFTVTLSQASTGNVTVHYATANGTALAGSDYTATSGTLTFTAGQTSKTVTVNVSGDAVAEPNETFFVNLSSAVGATVADGQGRGTILNDDGPVLRINDVSRAEGSAGATAFTFTVALSPASAGTVTVHYATANVTAVAGSDYTATSGTLTFTAGQTSKTVTVNVSGDAVAEPNETFFVNLSNAVGATIADNQGAGMIVNDDGPVLRINDVRLAEGNAGTTAFAFTVTLSPASAGTVTVHHATANGTALAGSDYTATSGTLTFTAGQTSKTVTVNVVGNTVAEPNETFFVNLSSAVGATIADNQGAGVIVNDDGPRLSITNVSATEGNAGTKAFTFSVTLTPASTGTVSVHYATANGTALAGSDYTATSGTLTFTSGQTSKTVTVNVLGSTVAEPSETFFVNLTNAVGATIFHSQGMGTITNDD